jgi:hypothetical protein
LREAIASGEITPVETTLGYPVDATDPDAHIKLSEVVAYGKTKGIWWGNNVSNLATALGFVDVKPLLADAPAPEQNTATPAGAGASVGPAPLTTGDIAHCFDGLRWGESEWRKPLGDKPKWLSECVAIPGRQGVSETRWNPVLIGAALVQQGHVKARNVRAKFQTVDLLKPWLDEWKTYEADNLDTL